MMLTGRCLCGGVRFEIHEELGPIVYCHCSMCRRVTGSAFATNASVRAAAFRIIEGNNLISEYKSSADNWRGFCSRCGSPLYGRSETHPETRRIRLGSLEGDPGAPSVAHIWVGSKAVWFEPSGDLDHFEQEAPERYFMSAVKSRRS